MGGKWRSAGVVNQLNLQWVLRPLKTEDLPEFTYYHPR